jgi:Serine/threonine protein kinase
MGGVLCGGACAAPAEKANGIAPEKVGAGRARSGSKSPVNKRSNNSKVSPRSSLLDRAAFAQIKTGGLTANYQVERDKELGSGSFGVVHRARDIRNDALVAVKTIQKKRVSEPKKVKEEFNVIRQLDHPHICKAFECYEDRKNIYLVMELLTGGTLLDSLVKRSGSFTESDAASLMRQVFSALTYLHEKNFIFRDLKTENVMFARTADPCEEGTEVPLKSRASDSDRENLNSQGS